MKINTKGTNIDISNNVRDYLEKKLSSIEKFLDNDSMIDVELKKTTNHHKSGDIFGAEINVWNKGKLNRVERSSADLYSAIDLVQDELFDVLSTQKDKKVTLFKRGAQKIKNLFRKS